ncbi:MAG: DUF805 domain-containing protein [Bacteroidales bacterium]|nr:DUF805 domain-containing protein [Bacteroidales bacterium]
MYQYQVSFGAAVRRAFSKYCCFTGRASRSEYWWFQLFLFIIGAIISSFSIATTVKSFSEGDYSTPFNIYTVISYIWGLIILLPSWGLLFRRLHDTGRSGWNWCWCFLPIVGAIILLVFCCQESQPQENKYGPVPNLTEA